MSKDVPPADRPDMQGTGSDVPARPPSFLGRMSAMWLYTTLRFGLFFALWGILLLVGLSTLLAALLGLVLSVPLSFVLLARPRARFTATLEARVDARRVDRSHLDSELDPDAAVRDGLEPGTASDGRYGLGGPDADDVDTAARDREL